MDTFFGDTCPQGWGHLNCPHTPPLGKCLVINGIGGLWGHSPRPIISVGDISQS